jgi:hypothetical protein
MSQRFEGLDGMKKKMAVSKRAPFAKPGVTSCGHPGQLMRGADWSAAHQVDDVRGPTMLCVATAIR